MFCSGHKACSEKHQFYHLEELYLQLAVRNQDHIAPEQTLGQMKFPKESKNEAFAKLLEQETTACLLPCAFTEYKVLAR